MDSHHIPGLTQARETKVTDLLVVRMLDHSDRTRAIRAAVRSPGGMFTLRTWSYPVGALRVSLVDEIGSSCDQMIQDVLYGVIGAQETLDGR